MRGGAVAVVDLLKINVVISFHCSVALVGVCVFRVDLCSFGLWHLPLCVHFIVIFVLHFI